MIIPNLDFGGAQRSFCSLANALHEHHQVYVCVFNTVGGVSFQFNAEIIDLKVPAGSNWILKAYRFYQRWLAIKRVKNKLKIEVTISYLEGANYLNVLSKGNDRTILSVRGSQHYDETIAGWTGVLRKKYLIPRLYKKGASIVALNFGIKQELEQMGIPSTRVKVIRNFYDIPHITSLANEPIPADYLDVYLNDVIIYGGRLASGKGLKSIIDVFVLLKKGLPKLRLVILGDGPNKENLVAYSQSFELSVQLGTAGAPSPPDVLFVGYQKNPYPFIKNATVLLIASTSEGGPNILCESIICDTLVVATNCPYGPGEQLASRETEIPSDRAFVGRNGILLPMLTKGQEKQTLSQWEEIIAQYINDSTARIRLESSAKSWVNSNSKDQVLAQWNRLL